MVIITTDFVLEIEPRFDGSNYDEMNLCENNLFCFSNFLLSFAKRSDTTALAHRHIHIQYILIVNSSLADT